MPMTYEYTAILDSHVPKASSPIFQHLLDTYASETNKVVSVWRCFSTADLAFRPHPRSKTVVEIMKHQLLSERRSLANLWAYQSHQRQMYCRRMRLQKLIRSGCRIWPNRGSVS